MVVIISLIGVFTSCNKIGKEGMTVDYLPFVIDDELCLVDSDLKPILQGEFKYMGPVINGVFFASDDEENISLYKLEKGKPVQIKDCEKLKSVGLMSEEIIPVVKEGERITYVDKDGKTKFTLTPHKEREIREVSPAFIGGKAKITAAPKENNWNEKEGVINTTGKVIVEPIYSDISLHKDFILAFKVTETEKADEYGYPEFTRTYSTLLLDNNGKKIKEFKDRENGFSGDAYSLAEGTFLLKDKETRYYLYDKSGNELKKFSEKEIPTFVFDDYYVYKDREKGKYGIKDLKTKEQLMRAKYGVMIPVDNNTFVVTTGEESKWKLVTNKDEEKLSFDGKYDIIFPLGFMMKFILNADVSGWDDYLVAVDDDENIIILNKKGETIKEGEMNRAMEAVYGYLIESIMDDGVRSDYREAEEIPTETATEAPAEYYEEVPAVETTEYYEYYD